ncbi:MAG: gamma-glutamylcyclotransferase family protein [Gammaproteobacteria bacterium]
MSRIRYLAYGSNLHPARLEARVGAVRAVGVAELRGWRLDFTKRGRDGSGKCNLSRVAGALAFGVVYEMAADARPTLDRIEGAGHGYEVEWLTLGPYGRCFVYVAEHPHVDPTLKPWDWYHALVLAGAGHHDLPADYRREIAAVEARRDPDRERAALNLAVMNPTG